MTTLEAIPESLGVIETWVQKGRAHWLTCDGLNVRDVAKSMAACHARFITITATELPDDEGIRMEYHWDLEGQLLGFPFQVSNKQIESIYDLCEAADWIEREIHEYYTVDFLGREHEPLFLRPGDKTGVNLREDYI